MFFFKKENILFGNIIVYFRYRAHTIVIYSIFLAAEQIFVLVFGSRILVLVVIKCRSNTKFYINIWQAKFRQFAGENIGQCIPLLFTMYSNICLISILYESVCYYIFYFRPCCLLVAFAMPGPWVVHWLVYFKQHNSWCHLSSTTTGVLDHSRLYWG